MFSIAALKNGNFSWHAALSCALASKLAYENSPTIENLVVNSWGFARHVALDRGDTQGFIAVADEVILIAFRGTESLGDWIDNIDVLPTLRPYGHVHGGFVDAFALVEADIRAALSAANTANQKIWLTGHSLGGALATIAAAELKGAAAVTAIHTFGQPRLGDSAARAFIEASYPNRFMRFVNDDDVVPRIPPGYEHVGRLVHFDAEGNVQRPATEAAAASIESPPLTRAEFERLRGEVRRIKAQLRAQQRSDSEAALDMSLEGLFPSISDHRIDRYVSLMRRHASGSSTGALVGIEDFAASARGPRGLALEAEGGERRQESFGVLLRVRDANWEPPAGLQVSSRIGNLLSASGPVDVLKGLERDPGIATIEVSREAGRKELAVSGTFVGARAVHRPPISERGDAALVGLIDSGIDVLHEAFRDPQGKTRIAAIWDQRDVAGPSPNQVDAAAFQTRELQATYGTLHLASAIQAFVDGQAQPPFALRDPDEHGTHVASIAAGRAVGGLADGMAPEAQIVLVIPKLRTRRGDPFSIGYSTSHLDALNFLRRVAAGQNAVSPQARPIAINVSLGMNAGAHDGMSLLEVGFDLVTSKGQDPGLVIVKSAGNERGHGGHTRIQAFNGVMPIVWESDNKSRFQDYLELWYQAIDELEFKLIDPAGNASAAVSRQSKDVRELLGGNVCRMVLSERHGDNGDNRLAITIIPQAAEIQPGLWTLNVTGINVRSKTAQVDIWVERDDDARAIRFTPDVPETTVSIPGTADTVITVAACDCAARPQLTADSSFGPTRKGLPKPDLSAPGFKIVAAHANTADHRATVAKTGTSMAAPHVTGALALVLSHRHKQAGQTQHNAQQLRAALNQTVKFGGLHHPGFGNGVLDAERLFDILK